MADETKNLNTDATLIDRILALGALNTPIRDHPDGSQVIIVPEGFRAETLTDPDEAPTVTRRLPRFFETRSFIEYVAAFKREDRTRIFVDPASLRAEAIIDYDGPGEPDRGVHRAALQLSASPEWNVWTQAAANTKRCGLTQEEFAEFLEENEVNVVEPTAAELIELVTKMKITRTVSFRRTINLSDGQQQFAYTNEDGNGTIAFPPSLELGIPVFKGGQPYKVKVLLRYRLQDGGTLRFAMIVHRQEEILRDALAGDIEAIENATDVPVHLGVVL